MCVKDFISLLKHTTTLSPLTNCFRFRDACVCVCVHARARVCVCVCVFSPHKTPRSCSRSPLSWGIFIAFMMYLYLKHTASHCNTLKHTATHCNTLPHTASHCNPLPHTVTHCHTLQHTATHCSLCKKYPTNKECIPFYGGKVVARYKCSQNYHNDLVLELRLPVTHLWTNRGLFLKLVVAHLLCVVACCSVSQCAAVVVRCSVLQCVAVCCCVSWSLVSAICIA